MNNNQKPQEQIPKRPTGVGSSGLVMPQWDIQLFYTFPGAPRWESKEIFEGTESAAEKRAKELWKADPTANDHVALRHNLSAIKSNPNNRQ